jgi:hypothetical protein
MNNKIKTYIIAIHYNNTEFIQLQYESIQKYLINCDYEYVVFNDAKNVGDSSNFNNAALKDEIFNECRSLGVKCVEIPQEFHKDRNLIFPKNWSKNRINMGGHNSDNDNNKAGSRHCVSIQYALKYISELEDSKYFFNLDADMFFREKMDLTHFMKDVDIAHVCQNRAYDEGKWEYMWPNCVIIDLEKNKNIQELCWDGMIIYNKDNSTVRTDTGGETKFYLDKYRDVLQCKHISVRRFSHFNIDDKFNKYLSDIKSLSNHVEQELLLDHKIIHLRGSGSNWMQREKSFYDEQFLILKKYINNL